MDHRRPGTSREQIARGLDERVDAEPKSWTARLKEAQAVLAACAAICTTLGSAAVAAVRWTVRDVVRTELAEVRATALDARAKAETAGALASAIPQLRKEFDDSHTEQVRLHAEVSARLNELVGADMGFREMDQSIQRRIDGLLLRGVR